MSQANTGKVMGVSLALLCAALFMTAYTAEHPWPARIGLALFSEALAPFQIVNGKIHDMIAEPWTKYVSLIGVKQENQRMQERLEVLEAENSRLRELQSENKQLRALLRVTEEAGLTGIAARVVAYDPSNWARKVTINRGQIDNVVPGMAVLQGDGLVGQVIASGPHTSQVLLLTDPTSAVDVLLQKTRGRGVVEGMGERRCRLNYVAAEELVRIGDRVITSGMDGIFPKGLMVGVVSSVGPQRKGMLFHKLQLKTAVDFSKLENVLVIQQGGR